MNALLDAIRDACAANAPDDARERGAQACQTLYAILSTPAGAPLVINAPPPPPPVPIAAAASGKKGRAKSAAAAIVTAADLVALRDIASPDAIAHVAQADVTQVAQAAQAATTHRNVAHVAQPVAPPDIAPPTEPAPGSSDPTTPAAMLPSFDSMPTPPPAATPLTPAAAVAVSMISALRNMPPEQLMELAIARLRAALPADVAASSPAVAPVRFHFIPLPRQGS